MIILLNFCRSETQHNYQHCSHINYKSHPTLDTAQCEGRLVAANPDALCRLLKRVKDRPNGDGGSLPTTLVLELEDILEDVVDLPALEADDDRVASREESELCIAR